MQQHVQAAEAFLGAWPGPAAPPAAALVPVFEALLTRCRERWPGVALDPALFAGHLAARAPADMDAAGALATLRVEDLYLACAVAQRLPAALRLFEDQLRARVPVYLGRLHIGPDAVDDTLQLLREKLLLGAEGGPPKILLYDGCGALDSWLRVTAVRAALNRLDPRPPAPLDESAALAAPPGQDPELDYLKARYRGAFAAAFRQAVTELPSRDRNLLRYQFLDGLLPEHIGRLYGVHRTTAARWVALAQERVLAGTRALLKERLRVSTTECDSLLGLLRSQLGVTLRSLLRTPA